MRRIEKILAQCRADIAAGRYVVESARQHLERLQALFPMVESRRLVRKSAPQEAPASTATAKKKVGRRSPPA